MTVYLRSDWRARAPRTVNLLQPERVDEWFLHYSTGEELGVTDCARWVRNIQTFHMDERGWSDVAYHWMVCRHGDAFEGRGWRVEGAATYGRNSRSVAVCFLGDDDPGQDVTPEARATIRRLADEADSVYGRKLSRRPHSDVRDTDCPGDELRSWLAAGMPLEDDIMAHLSEDAQKFYQAQYEALSQQYEDGKADPTSLSWLLVGYRALRGALGKVAPDLFPRPKL